MPPARYLDACVSELWVQFRMFPTITTSCATPWAHCVYTPSLHTHIYIYLRIKSKGNVSLFFLHPLSLCRRLFGRREGEKKRGHRSMSRSIYLAAIAEKLDGEIDVTATASQVEADGRKSKGPL